MGLAEASATLDLHDSVLILRMGLWDVSLWDVSLWDVGLWDRILGGGQRRPQSTRHRADSADAFMGCDLMGLGFMGCGFMGSDYGGVGLGRPAPPSIHTTPC